MQDKRERRKLPAAPDEALGELPTEPDEIDAFNQRMTDYWSTASLVPCTLCGRTFR